MHNLDRTMFEAHEIGHGETAEQEQEDFLGILGSLLGQSGGTHETETETEAGETGELELAAELLEVRDEAELDRFLGALMKSVTGGGVAGRRPWHRRPGVARRRRGRCPDRPGGGGPVRSGTGRAVG